MWLSCIIFLCLFSLDAVDSIVCWYKNGQPLHKSLFTRQIFDGKLSKLILTTITDSHSGLYECAAANTGGEVRSCCRVAVMGRCINVIFKILNILKKFPEEIFKFTVLRNTFLRFLTTLILCQKPILFLKFDHNPNSDKIIKLHYCVQICPNCSRVSQTLQSYQAALSKAFFSEGGKQFFSVFLCVAKMAKASNDIYWFNWKEWKLLSAKGFI